MPYASNDDIPADVKRRFSDHCQTVWRNVWNDTYDRHKDEGRAFATAESAGQGCMKATKTTDDLSRAVKMAGKDRIEGLALPFGGPFGGKDLDAETFTAETDFCLDWFGKSGRPLLYEHGMDRALKTAVVGRQIDYEVRDEGVWAQAQLDTNARYRKTIEGLIDKGALGFSSGAMPHLATKSLRGNITRFPWVELSLTPKPSNPYALDVHYVKSADLFDHFEEAALELPTAAYKALAEWADAHGAAPGSEQFTDRLVRVSDEVRGLADHAGEYAEMRANFGKVGRVLSQANRERITAVVGSRQALIQAFDELEALLRDTDPEAASKSADALWIEFLRSQQMDARMLGVPVTPG